MPELLTFNRSRMSFNANFKDNQYFYVDKKVLNKQPEELLEEVKLVSLEEEETKAEMPKNTIHGSAQGHDRENSEVFEEYFNENLKSHLERETDLGDLEYVAGRSNKMLPGHYSPAHEDYGGYVVSVMPVNEFKFKGGTVVFTQDNGLKVKLKLKKDQILVMKCTNTHEVEIITDGVRETLALFARPQLYEY